MLYDRGWAVMVSEVCKNDWCHSVWYCVRNGICNKVLGLILCQKSDMH